MTPRCGKCRCFTKSTVGDTGLCEKCHGAGAGARENAQQRAIERTQAVAKLVWDLNITLHEVSHSAIEENLRNETVQRLQNMKRAALERFACDLRALNA